MDLELSHEDIVKLFKALFGDEITPMILDLYKLKVSSEIEKAALSRVKLGDLTLADLASIMKPPRKVKTKPAPQLTSRPEPGVCLPHCLPRATLPIGRQDSEQ